MNVQADGERGLTANVDADVGLTRMARWRSASDFDILVPTASRAANHTKFGMWIKWTSASTDGCEQQDRRTHRHCCLAFIRLTAPQSSDLCQIQSNSCCLHDERPPDAPDSKRLAFLQTEIASNPDNSGGPVFNRNGEVIGIDVGVYGGSEHVPSLTFAIPIDAARARMQPEGSREASKGRLGVEVQEVDQGLAGAFGLPRAAGALVIAVAPGSPALDAGLKPGDVVEQVGDKTIDHAADFVGQDAALAPGETVALRIVRDARPMTVTINPHEAVQTVNVTSGSTWASNTAA